MYQCSKKLVAYKEYCCFDHSDFRHVQCLLVLVSSGTQVQPQVILDPDYLPDYLSVSYTMLKRKEKVQQIESAEMCIKGRSITFTDGLLSISLSKRCSENIQQIYRRTSMSKCDFNKVALQLY